MRVQAEDVTTDFFHIALDALQCVGDAGDDEFQQEEKDRVTGQWCAALAFGLVCEDAEGQGVGVAHGGDAVGSDHEGDGGVVWIRRVESDGQPCRHVECAFLGVESAGFLDLLHFFAGRELIFEPFFRFQLLGTARIEQIEKD